MGTSIPQGYATFMPPQHKAPPANQSPGDKKVSDAHVDIDGDGKRLQRDLKAAPSEGAAKTYNADMKKMLGDEQVKTGDAHQKLGADEKGAMQGVMKDLQNAGKEYPNLDASLQGDMNKMVSSSHGQVSAPPAQSAVCPQELGNLNSNFVKHFEDQPRAPRLPVEGGHKPAINPQVEGNMNSPTAQYQEDHPTLNR